MVVRKEIPERIDPLVQLAILTTLFVVSLLVRTREIEGLGHIPFTPGCIATGKVLVDPQHESSRVEGNNVIGMPTWFRVEVPVVRIVGVMGILKVPDQNRLIARLIAEDPHQLVFPGDDRSDVGRSKPTAGDERDAKERKKHSVISR